jgi:hypothetical protein
MNLSTETLISIAVTVVTVAGNIIQWMAKARTKQEMDALFGVCGNYLHIAGQDRSARSTLHARAEGVITSLWESLGRLKK